MCQRYSLSERSSVSFELILADPNSKDIWMTTAQVLFLFAALFHVPITLFPSREQIYIFYRIPKIMKYHLPITGVMTVLAFVIPCVYPDITGILGLLGGLTVGSSGYLIPSILKVASLKDYNWYSPYKLAHIFLTLGIFGLQVASIYVSIFQNNSPTH